MRKHGERGCAYRAEPFPFFEFQSVKDPCKVYVENLASSPRHQFGAKLTISKNSAATAASGARNYDKMEGYDGHEILIEKHEFPTVNFALESKSDKQEQVILENVSGGSGWQSMLSCSDYIVKFGARDHRKSLEATFEKPLDYIIDKCLLQEILLQYPYIVLDAVNIY